jgi:ABC-type multidrug transport system fused ATPase/permease subunit
MDRIKKLLLLLSRREKKNLALLVAALVICSFIGVAGIASIMPFIQVLSKPEVIRTNEVLAWIYSFLGFTDPYRFMLILGVTLLCVFIFSNLFLTVTIWMELYFVRMIGYNMTRNLFIRYVRSPYSFFLLRNSSTLVKNLFSEVQQVLKNLVKPFMEIITKGILALAIVIFLLVVNLKCAYNGTFLVALIRISSWW